MSYTPVVVCCMPNGALDEHKLSKIAHERAVTNLAMDIYAWATATAARTVCFWCNGTHSPMVCPHEKCAHCGVYGHWDFICPNAGDYVSHVEEIKEDPACAAYDARLEANARAEDEAYAAKGIAVVYPIHEEEHEQPMPSTPFTLRRTSTVEYAADAATTEDDSEIPPFRSISWWIQL